MKFFPKSLYFTWKRSQWKSDDIPYPVLVTKVTDDYIEYVEIPAEEDWIEGLNRSQFMPVKTEKGNISRPERIKRRGKKDGSPDDRDVWNKLVRPSVKAYNMDSYFGYFPNGRELFQAIIYNSKGLEHPANGKARVRDLFKIKRNEGMKLSNNKLKEIIREEIASFLGEAVRVDTDQFVNSHGRDPKGTGYWMFDIEGETFEVPTSSYKDAVKKAKKKAKELRARSITVLP